MRLTDRDTALLAKLYLTRYLTSKQILRLYFPGVGEGVGHIKACERRLRALTVAGYLRRIIQRGQMGQGRLPYVYALAKSGAEVVAETLKLSLGDIDYHPKEVEEHYVFLTHLLNTNSLYLAISEAAPVCGVTLLHWDYELTLRKKYSRQYVEVTSPEGKKQKQSVIPDAMCILEVMVNDSVKKSVCFIEIDQQTVTLSPALWESKGWAKKVEGYKAFLASPLYRNEFGSQRARVLTVTTTETRLQNMVKTTISSGGGGEFWFATGSDAFDSSKVLNFPIWSVAGNGEGIKKELVKPPPTTP